MNESMSHPDAVWPLRGWRWRASVGLVLLLAVLSTGIGGGKTLPLDGHEALVARTAEEMVQSGDWLVPRLNSVPRLKKPPLMYWLVIATYELYGGEGPITERKARLPAMAAAVGLVAVVLFAGAARFGRPVGLIAGLIAAANWGVTTYARSARPEMLYALWCTAGLCGFMLADAAPQCSARQRWWSLGGWLAWALAMLTKGPQLPALMLAGLIVALGMTGGRQRIIAVLRPVTGLPLFLVLALSWYLAVVVTHPDALTTWRNELGAKVEGGANTLKAWLEPFYLVNGPKLLMPWIVLVPLAALTPWFRRLKNGAERPAVWLLWWPVVVSYAVLQLVPGRRDYYTLPLLGPCALLMALAVREVGVSLFTLGKAWLWAALAAAHAAALVVALLLINHHAEGRPVPVWAIAVVAVAAVLAAAAAVSHAVPAVYRRSTEPWIAGPAWTLIAGGLFFVAVSRQASVWSDRRFDEAAFAERLARHVPETATLMGWSTGGQIIDQQAWTVEQYYLHRTIPVVDKPEELAPLLQSMEGGWLLVDPDHPPTLPTRVEKDVVLSEKITRTDRAELWHVQPAR